MSGGRVSDRDLASYCLLKTNYYNLQHTSTALSSHSYTPGHAPASTLHAPLEFDNNTKHSRIARRRSAIASPSTSTPAVALNVVTADSHGMVLPTSFGEGRIGTGT